MKCPDCDSEEMKGYVQLERYIAMAKRNGTVKIAGEKVSQLDLKEKWDKNDDGSEKDVKGPIFCMECGERFEFVVSASQLRKIKEGTI